MTPLSPEPQTQSAPDATPPIKSGWNRLPAELRLEIYRQVWEPRTVVISAAQNRQKFPVTLHINYESREETLKHYHHYNLHYVDGYFEEEEDEDEDEEEDEDGGQEEEEEGPMTGKQHMEDGCQISQKKKDKNGYIYPRLDIIRLGLLYVPDPIICQPKLEIPIINQPSLRVIIGQDADIHHSLGVLAPIYSIIRTIDFWSLTNDHPSNSFSWYRACRVPPSIPFTPVARWEDVVFRPTPPPLVEFSCANPACRNPTLALKWEYMSEETRVITTDNTNLANLARFGVVSNPGDPAVDSALKIPCAVVHWTEVKARSTLQKDQVLLFDAGSESTTPATAAAEDDPKETWAMLKVVSPDKVWHKEVASMALRYHWSYLAAKHNGVWYRVGPSPNLDDLRFLFYILRYPLPEYGEIIHGVCGPRFMYEGYHHDDSEFRKEIRADREVEKLEADRERVTTALTIGRISSSRSTRKFGFRWLRGRGDVKGLKWKRWEKAKVVISPWWFWFGWMTLRRDQRSLDSKLPEVGLALKRRALWCLRVVRAWEGRKWETAQGMWISGVRWELGGSGVVCGGVVSGWDEWGVYFRWRTQ
ncbi:hypothetical protein B0T21DRAFT_414495 [Apiosordaria backusii]|uniref:2EXR domain-containing protein n=1 Tax=Apiosordaria backusii TaxID=314023 RepID=A0AA40AST6_9PEZI|nr:hypothetical protein B0T21DRAFT_414495 [Apiosordaria backusii]